MLSRIGMEKRLWISLVFLLRASFGAEAVPPGPSLGGGPADGTIGQIAQTVAACRKNLADQDAAWPTRERDQKEEGLPPLPVRELQSSHRYLVKALGELQDRLEAECLKDPGPLLQTLETSGERDLVEALVPVAVRAGLGDERMAEALIGAAKRLDPCPAAIVQGLSRLEVERAGLFLLDRGMREGDLSILQAAGWSGEPEVLRRIIGAAGGTDRELAGTCLRALERMTPPPSPAKGRVMAIARSRIERLQDLDPALRLALANPDSVTSDTELEGVILKGIAAAHSPELKVALVIYLGHTRNPAHISFLKEVYKSSGNDASRIAAIGALGNLGEASGEFILGELQDPGTRPGILRACIHALGGMKYRRAARTLIGLLDDEDLQPEASRALERIAGEALGDRKVVWIRWLKSQPALDGEESAQDPEA